MSKKISTSVESGANVIIGQTFFLDIILNSDENISSEASVKITKNNNIDLQGDIPPIKLSEDGNKGVISVELYVYDDITENESVYFTIEPDSNTEGFPDYKVEYTAQTVDESSLRIKIGTDYLKVPDHSNFPPHGRYFSPTLAIVKSKNGTPLSGTPISILDIDGVFDSFNFYAADKKTKLEPILMGNYRGFTVNTDSSGKLVSYIYAIENKSAVLNIHSEIMGITGSISADKTLYVIDDRRVDPFHEAYPPIINDAVNGVLHPTPGATTFSVTVPLYHDAANGDAIFFFFDGLMIDPPFHMVNIPDQLQNLQLPYSNFLEKNKPVKIHYVIIKESADRYVSDSTVVTYSAYDPPTDNVYEKCEVYSSIGTNQNDLISESDIVNCRIISHYKNNSGHDGLFVKITGTNDSNDKTKIPLGSEVTLHLHIRSKQKRLDKSFVPVTMPNTAGDDGITNKVIS
ncbi:hypothetical protein [Xenorhabdus sp. PB62.4]|uniref:hypothetical protein n=1 Tax=Xenorhabdus sp. PB62.4 TaxID=1851573 RepID=UPI0016574E0E|nr:hypothetical protein [Xenorhabdus sp. PB62.4]MBC8953249.1 hypothetical protein [Xenorhabdus sp. PB62.4]